MNPELRVRITTLAYRQLLSTTMIAEAINYAEIISQLPADSFLIRENVSWEEYEDLLEQVGEASGLRISYDDGTLQIMTVGPKHESYSTFIERLVGHLSFRLRIIFVSSGPPRCGRRKSARALSPTHVFMSRLPK